jgi:hypothetical protein
MSASEYVQHLSDAVFHAQNAGRSLRAAQDLAPTEGLHRRLGSAATVADRVVQFGRRLERLARKAAEASTERETGGVDSEAR